jgi:hypothetical protein
MGEQRNADSALVGKTEGKRPPGRNRCRWITIHFKATGCESVE